MRDENGRFLKGYSGNPKGGKPGPRHRITGPLGEILPDEEFAKLLAAAVRAGESWAFQLVADRIEPKTNKLEATFPDGVPERAERFKTPAEHRDKVRELLEVPHDATLQ